MFGSRYKLDTQLLYIVSGQQGLAQFSEEKNPETWICLTKHLTCTDLQQLTFQHLKFSLVQ